MKHGRFWWATAYVLTYGIGTLVMLHLGATAGVLFLVAGTIAQLWILEVA